VRITASNDEGDHHIDLAEVVARNADGKIVSPINSALSSVYSVENGPSKCLDGDLTTVCASLERTGAVLTLDYDEPVVAVAIFNRVNCLVCASRIVGATIEVVSGDSSFTDTFYPKEALVEGSVYQFQKPQQRIMVDGVEQTRYGTLGPGGVLNVELSLPVNHTIDDDRRKLIAEIKRNDNNNNEEDDNVLRFLQNDDRVIVTDPTKRYTPYNGVGILSFQTAEGVVMTCSGAVISRDTVLTNAHCIVDRTTFKYNTNFVFGPGGFDVNMENTGESPFGFWRNPLEAGYVLAFRVGQLAQNDIGIVRFGTGGRTGNTPRYLGDIVNVFGLRTTSNRGLLPADRDANNDFMIGPDAALVSTCAIVPRKSSLTQTNGH
jgi:V8-like Glu-specific endopeptidase